MLVMWLALLVLNVSVAALAWLSSLLWGRYRQRRFDRALAALSPLKQQSVPGLDARVSDFLPDGATDVRVRRGVVWILIEGADSQRIPPWYVPAEAQRRDGLTLPDPVREVLRELSREVRDRMHAAGYDWPDLCVMVESSERVQAGGPFYFK